MTCNYLPRLLLLSASLALNSMTAYAVESSADNMMLLAQNKKIKKRTGKTNKKKPTESSPDVTSTDQPAVSAETTTDASAETGSGSTYVYRDTLGAAPAFYSVEKAKVTKTEVEAAIVYVSSSSKTSSEVSDSSQSSSAFLVGAVVTKPFSKLLLAGGGLSYTSTSVTSSFSTDSSNGSSKASGTNLTIPVYVVAHLSSIFDAGFQLDYHAIDSTKQETLTTNFSYMTMKPSIGVHSKKYEAGFSYQPLVKAKGKLTSTNSDSSTETESTDSAEAEKEIPSEMRLSGRFLVAPKFSLGGAYQADSKKSRNTNTISLEAGFHGTGFQVVGGLNLQTTKYKSEVSDTSSTETQNGFVIEAVSLDRTKQPRFSAAFSYAPKSKKQEESTTTGSVMLVGAAVQLHF